MLKKMLERVDHIAIHRNALLLAPAQCIAIHEFIGTSTNGFYRFKQAIEALVPEIKGRLIPSSIIQKLSATEHRGVIRSRVVEANCIITRKGNRMGYVHILVCRISSPIGCQFTLSHVHGFQV